jgi:hypothetical protein
VHKTWKIDSIDEEISSYRKNWKVPVKEMSYYRMCVEYNIELYIARRGAREEYRDVVWSSFEAGTGN